MYVRPVGHIRQNPYPFVVTNETARTWDHDERGLLDEKYPVLGTSKQGRKERDSQVETKKVDVYAVRFLKEKNDELTLGQHAYTVFAKVPPGSVAVRYDSPEKARKQALGLRRAEIGIASFTSD